MAKKKVTDPREYVVQCARGPAIGWVIGGQAMTLLAAVNRCKEHPAGDNRVCRLVPVPDSELLNAKIIDVEKRIAQRRKKKGGT